MNVRYLWSNNFIVARIEHEPSTVTTPVKTEVSGVIKYHIVQVYSANMRATVTFESNKVIWNLKNGSQRKCFNDFL